MSIDRTTWVGYGVTGIIDDESDLLRESAVPAVIRAAIDNAEEEDVETQLDEWLKARGVDVERVTVFVSGNSWTGVERWNVIAGSTTSVDESDPIAYIDPPTELDMAELARALELLGIDRKPSMFMQMDVN